MDEKKRYDFDYTTQFKKEYYHLRERNIRPMVSTKDDETGVITFRYRRTSKLFRAVAEFYEKYENERMFDQLSKAVEAVKAANGSEDPLEGVMSIDPKMLEAILKLRQKAETENDDHGE